MKKTLVALAALAATSAFAQSTVTISGNVDLGMQTTKQNGYAATLPGDATGAEQTSKVVKPIGNGASGWTSSALGLDISEDLGNGTKAGYSVAIDLNSWAASNDTGAGTNQYFQNTRHSFVSLGNANMGEVRLGYQYTLDDQIQGGIGRATPTGNIAGRVQNTVFLVDPTIATATAAAPYREGYEKIDTGSFTRNNGIQYASPVINGFQGLAQWAQQKNDTAKVGNTNDGQATAKIAALAGKYSSGPLNLGLAHTTIKQDGAPAGSTAEANISTKTKMTDLAANYDLGVAKVFANKYSRKTDITAGSLIDGTSTAVKAYGGSSPTDLQKVTNATQWGVFQDGGSLKRTGWDLGVSAPFGKTTLFASLGRGKNKYDFDGSGDVGTVKIKGKLLGATYDLSKRTSLNAYYGSVTAKAEGSDDNGLKKTQTGFGLRHSF